VIVGYHLVIASSVGDRDGMGLELTRDDSGQCVAEVFEDDESRRRTVTLFERDLPVEAVEWLLQEARTRL
jgi:hypothetical protein